MKKTICFLLLLLMLCPAFAVDIRITNTPRQLLQERDGFFMNPKWSPDGSKIAFTGSNYKGLWVLYLDSGKSEQISDDMSAGYGFEWSPNSRYITTRVSIYKGVRRYNAVKLFDVEAQQSRLLSEYTTSMPNTPHFAGGSVYLYMNGHLHQYDTGIESLKKEVAGDSLIVLAGDRMAIAHAGSDEIDLIAGRDDERYLNPALSPNGKRIACEIYGGNLVVMNSDGSGRIDLGIGYHPHWSPDGEYIVYMISRDDGHQITASDLYVAKSDGSQIIRLTESDDRLEMNPHWSPGGRQIVYDDYKSGQLFIADIDITAGK